MPSDHRSSAAIVVTDADACVPAPLLDGLPLAVAPPDAPLLLQPESVPRLRLEVAPPDPAPVAAACAEAAALAGVALYVMSGDGYGANPAGIELARSTIETAPAPGGFLAHESRAALMGCGWQAVAAARALRDGASTDEALGAAADVAGRVRVLVALEHPELAGLSGFDPAARLRLRAVAMLEGDRVEVIANPSRRDAALVTLRDRFYALAEGDGPGALHVAVHHAAAAAGAQALATWTRRALDPAELWLAPLTRHAATRLGPRMLGLAWYRDPV